MKRFTECRKDDRGFTALETAIILMAFVVVASVFAFTMLSSGMSSTEQSKQAIAAGMEEVAGSVELRGSVIATADSAVTPTKVSTVTFYVANSAGGDPIDLTAYSADDDTQVLTIDYMTSSRRDSNIAWTATFVGNNDGDALLEDRELAQIEVTIPAAETLATNTEFKLEVRPEQGGVLPLIRTTPAHLDAVMDLG